MSFRTVKRRKEKKMEVKKKTEITVGSVVRVVKVKQPFEKRFLGRIGVVVSVVKGVVLDCGADSFVQERIRVEIDRDFFWCDEAQVQLVITEKQKVPEPPKPSPKRTIVIEITDDGANAKYVIGKKVEKTASVKRHKDDKPDDQLAAHYVVGKLFGQKVMKDNVDMDALKNAKYDCMIARYHLDEISKVLDPFGEPDFGKVDFKF